MARCEPAGSMRVRTGICPCMCQCACVPPVALLAAAGLDSHHGARGRSHACESVSVPSLRHQSPDPPRQLCRGLGLLLGQEGLGGPWSR